MEVEGTRQQGLGYKKNPAHVKVKDNISSILSLVVAVAALFISGLTLWLTLSPRGDVHAIEPSSYTIIRQDNLGSPGITATTEHLVLPMELENTRGRSVLIRQVALTVSEAGEDSETHRFNLVKEYPELSGTAFTDDYTFSNTLSLEPHSVSSRVLSFRSEDKNFEFDRYTEYEVRVEFLKDRGNTPEKRPESDKQGWQFCTYDTRTSNMISSGDIQWNWWRFEESSNGNCEPRSLSE